MAMDMNSIHIKSSSTPTTITEILPQETEYYCIMDASCKSSDEKISIGWSLFSKQGTLRLKGSAAMDPSHSPLISESTLMWLVVRQMHTLVYNKVAFLGDFQELINYLDAAVNGGYNQKQKKTEAHATIQDIRVYASCHFSLSP